MNKVISLFMKFTIGLLIVVSTFTTAFAQQSSHFTYLCLPEGSVVPYSDVKAIAFHFNPKTKSMTGYTSVKVTDTKQPNTPSDIRTLGLYKLDPIRNIGPEQLWEEYLRLTNYLGTVLDMDDKTYAKYHLRIEPTKFISDSYIYKLNGATSKIDPDLLPKNLQTTLLKGSIERYTFHYAMKRNDLNNGAPIINMQFYLSYSLLSIEQQKGATNYFELTCERQYPHEEELAIQEAFTKQWQKKKAEEKKTKEEEKSGLSKGTIKNFPTPNEGQIRELMDDWDSFDNNEQRNQLKLDTELLITAAAVSGAVVFLKMSKTGLKRIAPIAIIPALLLSAKASGSVCKSPHFFENLANSELYKLHHCLDVSPELRLQFAYAYHANKINKEKKKRNKLEIKD